MTDDVTAKSLKFLTEVEVMAEEILSDRQEIVALDERRNNIRVALRELKKSNEKKTWITIGSNIIRMSSNNARTALEKDQAVLGADINQLQSNLKVKVNKLRDLEHQNPVPGLMLNPMSNKEIMAIKQGLKN